MAGIEGQGPLTAAYLGIPLTAIKIGCVRIMVNGLEVNHGASVNKQQRTNKVTGKLLSAILQEGVAPPSACQSEAPSLSLTTGMLGLKQPTVVRLDMC